MVKTGKYVHGTAAEQLEYDVYQENNVLKQKKKQRSYHKVKAKACLCIMIVFAFGFAAMYRYAVITQLSYDISKTNKTLNELKKENSRITVEIDKSMDLSKVREIAENKLGMIKPDRFQTINVAVPKSDYTKVSEEYLLDKESGSAFSVVLEKLEKFTRLLY